MACEFRDANPPAPDIAESEPDAPVDDVPPTLEATAALANLYDELLQLVPTPIHHQFGEVFYSGRTAFQRPSKIYLLGFNPGGDPTNAALNRYTIGADLAAARTAARDDWSGFEDDWRYFGPGAVAFQRRVRHLIDRCGYSPRRVPASNAVFVRSTRVDTLNAGQAETLLRDCWPVHQMVIRTLAVRVVVCFGQAAGRWVTTQLGPDSAPAIDSFEEDNARRWRSTTRCGRDGVQIVTLTHPSVADWTNPVSDPTKLVVSALARAARGDSLRTQ